MDIARIMDLNMVSAYYGEIEGRDDCGPVHVFGIWEPGERAVMTLQECYGIVCAVARSNGD